MIYVWRDKFIAKTAVKEFLKSVNVWWSALFAGALSCLKDEELAWDLMYNGWLLLLCMHLGAITGQPGNGIIVYSG